MRIKLVILSQSLHKPLSTSSSPITPVMPEDLTKTQYYESLVQNIKPEEIRSMIKGIKKLVAITEKKIYFIGKNFGMGLFGANQHSYFLSQISRATITKGLISGEIDVRIMIPGGNPSEVVETIAFYSADYDRFKRFNDVLKTVAPQS